MHAMMHAGDFTDVTSTYTPGFTTYRMLASCRCYVTLFSHLKCSAFLCDISFLLHAVATAAAAPDSTAGAAGLSATVFAVATVATTAPSHKLQLSMVNKMCHKH